MSQVDHFRTFLAITPDATVLDAVQQKIAPLRRELDLPGIRWEGRDKWHVTLRFLGDVPSADLNELSAVIGEVCRERAPFFANVASLGAFPSLKRPRVLWAGIEAGSTLLADLHDALRSETDRFTSKADDKRFRPHLTLARIRTESRRTLSQVAPAMQSFTDLDFGTWEVKHVELWRSILQPGGSRYELLCQMPLQR